MNPSILDTLTDLFATQGAVQYGSEAVSQKQHALQCAHLATQAGASPQLITAALLHDIGHLLPRTAEAKAGTVGDDFHQVRALLFMRGRFPDAVLQPIALHVAAKRYLCRVDRTYHAQLSAASQRSLAMQGGAFGAAEAETFIALPFASDSVALRRWDDLAKDPAATPPGWFAYTRMLKQLVLPDSVADVSLAISRSV